MWRPSTVNLTKCTHTTTGNVSWLSQNPSIALTLILSRATRHCKCARALVVESATSPTYTGRANPRTFNGRSGMVAAGAEDATDKVGVDTIPAGNTAMQFTRDLGGNTAMHGGDAGTEVRSPDTVPTGNTAAFFDHRDATGSTRMCDRPHILIAIFLCVPRLIRRYLGTMMHKERTCVNYPQTALQIHTEIQLQCTHGSKYLSEVT